MRISAIIPCLNEESNIPLLYEQVTNALSLYEDYEIIFIDDGSTDGTLPLIMELSATDDRVKYISLTKDFGLEAAIRYGYLYASYEWCIQYDADMQWPPEETHKLTSKAEEGYDAVFAIRKNRKDKLHRILSAKIQQFIASDLLHIEIPKGASSFKLVKTSLARKVLDYPIKAPYFIATVPLITSNYTTVEVNHRIRLHGKSRFNIINLLGQSYELFFGFSSRMLNISAVAFVVSSLLFIIALILSLINPAQSNGLFLGLLCFILLMNLLSKAVSDQYLKYPVRNRLYHDTVFVQKSNIEACIKERIT